VGLEEIKSAVKMSCMRCQEEFPEGTQICPHDGTRLILALPDPLIGKTFAERYEIIEVLGRGGMSVVYKAQQKFMQNFVAIKVLHPQFDSDPSNFERFKQEAIAAISIRDKNVIQVLDFGISDGQSFLIMEYLEGQDLADWLQKNGDMPVERALNIFIQACDGLAHAHAKGVIHRDLKPGNLFLIKESGQAELVKIVDFGIAKIQPLDGTAAQNLTQPGEVFGSPLYMSPEQCQGKKLDPRSDIYSLGCVLYETLTGMPPLMGMNSFETMNKHVGEQPLPLRGVAPGKDIPELLDACVLKAMRKDPDQRQQSMLDFKKELIESVKSSRIYLGASEGYAPKMFTGEEKGADAITILQPAEGTDTRASEALQQLVLDAVHLTQKQDTRNKQLRQMIFVLYGMLGTFVLAGVYFATAPGPASDPAPLYQKQLYLWKIADGEQAIREGKYKEGIQSYQSAVDMSADFGEGTEKKTKALFGLLVCLQRGGGSPELINSTRHKLLNSNVKHMEYIYGLDGHDLVQIVDMDAGLLQRIGGDRVDVPYAESLAKEYVNDARAEFEKHNYIKAISWLQEGLEIEEQSHCKAGVSAAAAEFAENSEARDHLETIKKLLERARVAEKEAKG
jgi:serine/threonine-protein kinase